MSLWVKCLFLLLALHLTGCGYTLNHRLKGPFEETRGVFVPVFENRSDETGAEVVFTNALIRELQSRGNVLLTDRARNGYELKGKVDYISYVPTNFTEPGFRGLRGYQRSATEIGIAIGVSISLNDPTSGREIWGGSFTGFRRVPGPTPRTFNYEAPSSVGSATQSLVEYYYASIAQDIMRDVYDTMVDLF